MRDPVGVPLGGMANGGWTNTWLMGSMGSRISSVWFFCSFVHLFVHLACYAGVGGIAV